MDFFGGGKMLIINYVTLSKNLQKRTKILRIYYV